MDRDQVFSGYLQRGLEMQHGALTNAVGCMRVVEGCDRELLFAAQAELGRFRCEVSAFWRGQAKSFQPVDRSLLARAWADWQVARIVEAGALGVAGVKS